MRGLFYFSILILMPVTESQAVTRKVQIGLASNFSEISANSFNPYGNYFRDGIQLAIEDSKSLLKKNEIQIELVEFDYGTSKTKVIESARKAISSPVIGVIGYNYSTDALLAAPIHQQGGLPMLTPSATAERIGKMDNFVHVSCFDNQFMGKALAGFSIRNLKAKNAAIVASADCAYCQDLGRAFEEEFVAKGGTVSKKLSVLDSDTEFSKVVTQLKTASFDVILVPNHELLSARVVSALLKSGIRKPFLGGDGWGNEGNEFYAVIGKQKFEGYAVSHWHPEVNNRKSKEFLSKYQRSFHKVPNDNSVLAYDAMSLVIQALLSSREFTRKGLENSLNAIRTFKGITGLAVFKEHSAPRKSLVFLAARQERFKVLGILDPEVK